MYPQHPKPTPGILVFARLAFLDSKVTQCYGCGYSLKPDRTIPRYAWWPCANYKTSPTILQGWSATNVTRYFKCVLPCQPILHQGDLSFLRAKFMAKTSRSPTVSSPRTQTDDHTKACCKVLVGLWSVTIMSPYHVPTIWNHQTLKTKTFSLLLTMLNCRI